MTTTLREVAERAGVDASTVSRVLRGDPAFSVRAETRIRITQVAAQLGYRPNAIARGLKTRSTRTLGMLIPDITNPLFPAIYKGVEDTARALGYSVILANTGARHEHPDMDLLKERRVDGFILATSFTSDEAVAQLEKEGYPFVLVNRRVRGMADRFVAPDDTLGAQLVMSHLLELGHRRIGHLSGPLYTETGLARFKTYRQSLKAHGLAFEPDYVVETDFREEAGYHGMGQLLQLDPRPTAVFCGNDLVALGAIRKATELGLLVPEELSVVGFNDLPWVDRLQPPLTTVRLPLYEMGTAAARMLIQILSGTPPDPAHWLVQPELIIRASTARLARNARHDG